VSRGRNRLTLKRKCLGGSERDAGEYDPSPSLPKKDPEKKNERGKKELSTKYKNKREKGLPAKILL